MNKISLIETFLINKVEELTGLKNNREEFLKTKISDIGLDSLSIFDLIMMLEQEFDCEIEDQFLSNEPTFEEISNYISSK